MTQTNKDGGRTILPAYYGEFGGQFVPESLLPALDELERAFIAAFNDEEFMAEYRALLRDYLGRPTPLTECRNLPLDGANARIFLKREDLVHGALDGGSGAGGRQRGPGRHGGQAHGQRPSGHQAQEPAAGLNRHMGQ